MKVGTTEQRNPASKDIDLMPTKEIVTLINQEDHKVADAVATQIPKLSQAVDLITDTLKKGGRLVYVGAGTSGRLGVLDASECLPTYSFDRVVGLIAGGKDAMFQAQEGAEDSKELARKQLQEIHFCADDIVCGIAASGRTPFVIGAFDYAHELGTKAIAVVNNQGSEVAAAADVAIEAVTGPEVVTGSTRMKAGTADKMILNILSTASMIKLGKTYSNLMIDLKISNEKLEDRAERIVALISGKDQATARQALDLCHDVKTAIVMLKAEVDEDMAISLLKACDGSVGRVFQKLGIARID